MIIGRRSIKRMCFAMIAVVILLIIYSYSPYKFQFLGYYHKVWAHRVNSIEKLQSALHYFEGIELDLVYDESNELFDVNHPPAVSIDLTFDNYLAQITTSEKPFLWLDIKNLKVKSSQPILNRLKALVKKHNYPIDKILVESQFPEALPIFTDYGFSASYYLNYKLKNMTGHQFESEIDSIKTILRRQPKIGISSSYVDYDLMHNYFPEKSKYVWALTKRFHPDYFEIRTILQDTTVKVVLAKYKALSGNR